MNDLKEIDSFSVNGKKQQLVLSTIFLLIAGLGVAIIFLTKTNTFNNIPVWGIVLSVLGFIVVHELIHIIFMLIFSKGKINVSFKFPTIAVGSNAYFNKLQYVIIALAPVIILGILCLICLIALPYKLLFTILLILNFASASGDYILTYYAIKQKRNVYLKDNANKTIVYKKIEDK